MTFNPELMTVEKPKYKIHSSDHLSSVSRNWSSWANQKLMVRFGCRHISKPKVGCFLRSTQRSHDKATHKLSHSSSFAVGGMVKVMCRSLNVSCGSKPKSFMSSRRGVTWHRLHIEIKGPYHSIVLNVGWTGSTCVFVLPVSTEYFRAAVVCVRKV